MKKFYNQRVFTHFSALFLAFVSCLNIHGQCTAPNPTVGNANITCGQTATLTASGGTNYTWYANAAGTQQVGSGASFTTPTLGSNTTYYVQNSTGNNTNIFYITSLSNSMLSFFETNTWTGDDRGGMAVTQQYCYLTGDNNTARYDMPNLTNPVSYTRRDGIFSDMAGAGTLYTLWNSTNNSEPIGTCTSFTINAVQTLNNDCSLGGTIIPTSQSITMGACNDAAIFNGVGFVIVYTGTGGAPANSYVKIDLPSGQVTTLGNYGLSATFTENWSRWGVAEYNGNDYSVVYVTNTNTISRLNLTTGAVTTVQSFQSLSDMASITYSPWDSRWYCHWEGGSQWGGSDESIGYLGGTHSSQNANACYSSLIPVTVTVNSNIPTPTANGTTINCGLTATLTASGGNGVGYTWYANAAGTAIAGSGASFTTPSLGTTTTYYLASTGGLGAGNSFTFTNAGATGPNGPNQQQINSSYANGNLANNVTVNTQGIQEWIVPSSGNYQIQVNGAQGGGNGGLGARMQGDFSLTAGQKLFIVVGQQGNGPADNNACGGGGGSFVTTGNASYTTSTPLIIAGGGGGQSPQVGNPGLITNNGGQGEGCQPGGTNGNGGADASACGSGAGGAGGFLTDGQSGGSWGYQRGFGFLSGAAVGGSSGSGSREGGFGGGAGTHLNNTGGGAGGGYSGGSAANHGANFEGGGGGSYNIGTNQVNTQGINPGNGSVVITSLTPLCASSLVPVTVTVNPATLPTANNVTTSCGQPATINASGNGTIYWYSDQAGTTLLGTGNTFTTPPLGNNTTYYVSTGAGVCGFQNIPVTVSVTTPANPTVSNTSINCGQTATLTASGSGANNYIWYANAAGTQQIGTGANYTTPSLANSTTYYVAAGIVSNAAPTTFTYTGSVQTYTVPAGVTSISVDAYGAGGGVYPGGPGTAGAGGRIQGTVPVTPGQVLTIVVGGAGGNSQYNRCGSGGGGFSGVLDATNNHLISAGGGGGAAGDEGCPQVGGGGNGGSTSGSNGSCGIGGAGGTNAAGPAGGAGGTGTIAGAAGNANGGGNGGATQGDEGTGGGGGGYGTAGAGSQFGSCGGNSGAGGFGGGGSGGTGGCGGTIERLSGGGGGGGGYTGGGGGSSTPGCAQCGGGGGGGGSNFAIPTATNITNTIGGGSAAQANGQVIITPNSASCQSGLTPVTVTVNAIGLPTAQNVSTPCGQTATLTATGNGTIYWYSDQQGTNLLGTGTTYTTPALTSNTTYYVSLGAGVCGGVNVPVTVTVTLPAAPTASNATITCGQTATLVASGGIGNYTWFSDPAGQNQVGTGSNFTTPSLNNSTTYYVGTASGPQGPVQSVGFDDCYAPANWNVVHLNGGNGSVNAGGAPANIILTGPNGTGANSYTMYETTISVNGTLSWDWSVVHNDPPYDTYGYRLNGVDFPLTTVTANGSTTIPVTAGQIFSFYGRSHDGCCGTFTATITNFNKPCQGPPSCQSTLTAVQVNVTSNIAPPIAAAGPTITCGQTATLTASGGGGNTIVWYSDSLGNNALTTGTQFTTPALGISTTYYVASGNGAGGGNAYSFTNAGATGETGPTQQQVTAAYANTNLANSVTVTTQGIQEWIVPSSGTYDITARGAQGGNANTAIGGSGASITVSTTLNAGDVIKVLCGQQGASLAFSTGYAGGGGGGTFVYNQTTNQLIVAAGGGGGAAEGDGVSYPYILNGVDASAYNVTSGANGLMSAGSWCSQGNGGTAGSGGGGGGSGGSGGAGWNSPGTAGQYGGTPGQPFTAGGLGGTNTMWSGVSTLSQNGGFGGGAGAGGHTNYEATGGGGGGYSGGGGGGCRVGAGGGGGCFYTGTYISSGLNTGNGSVDIVPQVPACTSPLVPVTVSVAPISLPTVTGVTTNCGQTATLTASGNGTIYWYSNAAGTNQVGTGNTYTTPVLTSTTTYYASTATGICAAQNVPAVVTVNGLTAPTVSGNTNFCGNANAITTLTASGSPSGYSWWSNPNGTGLLTNDSSFTTPALNTTTTYYVQSSSPQGGTQTFNFTGAVQAFTAPVSGNYTLEAWGAQGGNDPMNPNTSLGGRGGYSKGDVYLTAGTTLYVFVGGQGVGCLNSTWKSTGGGGATDFRLVGGNWNDNAGLYARILVAGGGGGRHGSNYENMMYVGNDGGGLSAPNFTANNTSITGASQTAGGSSTYGTSVVPGSFGFATPNNESNTCSVGGYNGGARGSDNWANGGAGGGWYGGCTSWPTSSGGSGYVYTATSFVPAGYTPNVSYQMTNEQLIAGNAAMPDTNGVTMTGNSGHGVAKITWSGTGCTSSLVPVTVSVGANPSVSAGSNQDICQGNNVTLSGTGADTYQWDNNVQDGVSFTPSVTQVYTVIGTAANGCTDTAQVTVNVNPLPTVSLGQDTLVCTSDIPFQLTATGSPNSVYAWSNGASGNPISISTAGTYTVTATNEFECSATDDIIIEISDCASLDEEGLSLNLYPNPFNESIQISSSESIEATIEVYGSDGRLVHVQTMKGYNATMNLVQLARGNYMVKLHFQGKTHVTNLVKQ